MYKSVALAVSASLIFPVIASANDQSLFSLAKTSKWEMNYDDDSCHLLAKFGDGKESVLIRLTRYQPGDRFDLSIYGEQFKAGGSTMPVKIGFGLNDPTREGAVLGTSSNRLPVMILTSLRLDGWSPAQPGQIPPPVTQAAEAKVHAIDFTISGSKHYRLETGSFGEPMRAMRTCLTDLITKWGYDPVVQASLKVPATPTRSPGVWLKPKDYPREALKSGHNGLVQFRLDISETGAVIGCNVLHRTNPDDFADLTCKLLTQRARFTPALDKDGKPVKGFFVSKVRFVVPE